MTSSASCSNSSSSSSDLPQSLPKALIHPSIPPSTLPYFQIMSNVDLVTIVSSTIFFVIQFKYILSTRIYIFQYYVIPPWFDCNFRNSSAGLSLIRRFEAQVCQTSRGTSLDCRPGTRARTSPCPPPSLWGPVCSSSPSCPLFDKYHLTVRVTPKWNLAFILFVLLNMFHLQ